VLGDVLAPDKAPGGPFLGLVEVAWSVSSTGSIDVWAIATFLRTLIEPNLE
jgi:hypothetical protein